MQRQMGGGGGGQPWTGQIQVCPGDLEASSPGFSAASTQALVSWGSIQPWEGAASTGITDSGAAAAWERLTHAYLTDLNNLGNGLQKLSDDLFAAGGSYQATDSGVMACRIVRG